MRRHTTGPASERETGSRGRADRAILTLYWLASGYGLRAWRSFTALAALAIVITVLMTGWGLAAAVAPQTLHGTTTAGRITATLRTTTPQPPPAGQRWTAERARTSAEITLDAFVFRTTDLPLTPPEPGSKTSPGSSARCCSHSDSSPSATASRGDRPRAPAKGRHGHRHRIGDSSS